MTQQVKVLEARPDDLSSNSRTPHDGSGDHTQNVQPGRKSSIVYGFVLESCTLSVSMTYTYDCTFTLDCEQMFFSLSF